MWVRRYAACVEVLHFRAEKFAGLVRGAVWISRYGTRRFSVGGNGVLRSIRAMCDVLCAAVPLCEAVKSREA